MLITRECDYAVRIIRALNDGQKKRVKDICDIEHVPQPYAYKILKKLESSQIVNSFRGVDGGYALAGNTKELTLYDVYVTIEGNGPITACLRDGFECPRNATGNECGVHIEFDDIQSIMIEALQKKTLSELFQ